MRHIKPLKGLMILALAALAACSGEEKAVRVDFNRVAPLDQPRAADHTQKPLRVAVGAMISPQKTMAYYQHLLAYLETKLGKRLELVQKKTYAEVSRMLQRGDISLAFVCSGPYARLGRQSGFKLLAAPRISGLTTYQAYLIVNRDSPAAKLEDLRGKIFAFTDPESNTGKLVPTYWLSQIGQKPESFFQKVVYTHAHDNSIMAVARGLVDGASVDGLIWDYHRTLEPALTSRTKIIRRSRPFGIPPVVGSPFLAQSQAVAIQKLLYAMHQDEEGKKILAGLHIERFVPAQDSWYQTVREMQAALH